MHKLFDKGHRGYGVLIVAMLAFVWSAVPTLAQSAPAPNLSGTYKLNLAKSRQAAGIKIKPETLIVTTSRSIVEFRYTANGENPTTRKYVVDGDEHFLQELVSSPNHFRSYYTSKWKGGALVTQIRMRMETSDTPRVGETEGDHVTERWSLSPDHRVLTQSLTGSSITPDQFAVFDRQ